MPEKSLIDTERFKVTVTAEHIRFGIQNDVFPLAIAIDEYFGGGVGVTVKTYTTILSQGEMTYHLHHEHDIREWLGACFDGLAPSIVVDVDKRGGWVRQLREAMPENLS